MRALDPWEAIKANPGIIVGGISTLFLAARILDVAKFDPETASEILQHGGTGTIILGTILSAAGTMLAGGLMLFGLSLMPGIVQVQSTNMSESPSGVLRANDEKSNEGILVFLVVIGAAAVLAIVPIAFVGFLALDALFVIFYNLYAGKVLEKSASSKSTNGVSSQSEEDGTTGSAPLNPTTRTPPKLPSSSLVAVVNIVSYVVVAYLLLLAVNTPPWFPLEKLSIKNAQSVTAYIVSDSGAEMILMLPRTRQIRYQDQSDITGRVPCEVNTSVFLRTLPQLLNSNNTKYAKCAT